MPLPIEFGLLPFEFELASHLALLHLHLLPLDLQLLKFNLLPLQLQSLDLLRRVEWRDWRRSWIH